MAHVPNVAIMVSSKYFNNCLIYVRRSQCGGRQTLK